MVIGIIGENCSGKSTLAEAIQKDIHAEIVTGKDYLRMAKSESEAAALFRKKLADTVWGNLRKEGAPNAPFVFCLRNSYFQPFACSSRRIG